MQKISIISFYYFINACWSLQNILADINENGTDGVLLPVFLPESDFNQQNVQIIKVTNDPLFTNTFNDPDIFVLVEDELHWLNGNAFVKLVKFSNMKRNNEIENINGNSSNSKLMPIQVQACRWEDKIIFVVDVERINYVYILQLKLMSSIDSTNVPLYFPIQQLSKRGKSQTISFIHFGGDIYCLLGSTSVEEMRSELRIFKWKQSYFQIIETIQNRDHKIDSILINPTEQLIILIDNKELMDRDTSVQIHRYSLINELSNDVSTQELTTKRIQGIFLPYSLSTGNLLLYRDSNTQQLYLTLCNGYLINVLPMLSCQFYSWKHDGIDDATMFQRLESFPLMESILNAGSILNGSNIDDNPKLNQILVQDSLVAIQNGANIAVINGQSTHFESHAISIHNDAPLQPHWIVNCAAENLLEIILQKTKIPDSNDVSHKILCIYSDFVKQNGVINFLLRTHELYVESLSITTFYLDSNTKQDITNSNQHANELDRIKNLLIGLKNHLIGQQEKYLRPMQDKLNDIKKVMKIKRLVQTGQPVSEKIICTNLKVETNSNSSIDKIIINTSNNTKSITTMTEELRKINENSLILLNEHAARLKSAENKSGDDRTWMGETLNVNKLTLKGINHLFHDIVTKRPDKPARYYLSGKIKTKILVANSVKVKNEPNLVGNSANETADLSLPQGSNIIVKFINGINWDQFVSSVYRKGKNTVIDGNIRVTHPTTIRKLYTTKLNNILIDDFLTLSTDQIIDSNVFISKMHVNNIQSKVFNDMKRFAENVAVMGRDNIIESRVKMFVCNVSENLLLSDSEGETMTQHIVGTRLEDLTQIYNGRVVIKGSLSLQNVVVSSNDDNLFSLKRLEVGELPTVSPQKLETMNVVVDGIPFDLANVTKQYWMKSLDQTFDTVQFVRPITTPQIIVNSLNSHPANEYFVLNDQLVLPKKLLPLSVMFEGETMIEGNLYTEEKVKTTLQKLSSDAVRRFDSSRIIISSPIKFMDRLIVDHIGMQLETNHFVRRNENANRPAMQKNQFNWFDVNARKKFTGYLFIENDIVILSDKPANIVIQHFNEHTNLEEYFQSMAKYDKNQTIVGSLVFEQKLEAQNITISKFIDNSNSANSQYDSYFDLNQILSEIYNLRENRIQYLQVNGDVMSNKKETEIVESSENVSIQTLNGIPLSNYLASVVLQSSNNTINEIDGIKIFNSNLSVNYANVHVFNREIFVNDWILNSFRKRNVGQEATQIVSGNYWQIETLTAENVQVYETINNVKMESAAGEKEKKIGDIIFIDNDPSNLINITSNLLLSQGLKISSSANIYSTQMRYCEINDLFSDVFYLRKKSWNYLSVQKNVTILSAKNYQNTPIKMELTNFFENAVLSGTDQTIYGNLTFKCNAKDTKITFNRINTVLNENFESKMNSKLPLIINDINLHDIYNDAVTKSIVSVNGETQPIVVRGLKTFFNGNVECNSAETISTANIYTITINNINIQQLNESLIRKNSEHIEIHSGHSLLFGQALNIETLIIGSNQTVNNVPIDDIFFVYTETELLPKVQFARRDVGNQVFVGEDLIVNLVHDISLKFFLENRVKKYQYNSDATKYSLSETQMVYGHITFENLVISGLQTKIESINDVFCDDIVLMRATDEQQITGHKEIYGENVALYIYQPFHTWKINDVEILTSYSKTIFLDQNQTIEQLTIRAPNQLKANSVIVKNQLNRIVFSNNDGNKLYTNEVSLNNESHLRSAQNGKQNKPATSTKRLNYIDISNDFKAAFNETALSDTFDYLNNSWLTIDTFYTPIVRSELNETESVCPMQYHLQPIHWPSKDLIVRPGKIASRLLTVAFRSDYLIHIRTEYPAELSYYGKCNFSSWPQTETPKSVVYVNYKEVLRYPDHIIESVQVFSTAHDRIYLILHIFNSGISILRHFISATEQKWTEIQFISLNMHQFKTMPIFNVRLLLWQAYNVLVVASSTSAIASASAGHLTFYRFNELDEKYQLLYEISGDFNIVSGINIPMLSAKTENKDGHNDVVSSDFFLILAKQYKNSINLLKAAQPTNADDQLFKLEEELKFDSYIESLSIFSEYDKTYLAVILHTGDFHIYEYRHRYQPVDQANWINLNANKWQLKMNGHFENGKAMLPFSVNKKLYLFVLLNETSGTVGNNKTKALNANIAKIFTLYYY